MRWTGRYLESFTKLLRKLEHSLLGEFLDRFRESGDEASLNWGQYGDDHYTAEYRKTLSTLWSREGFPELLSHFRRSDLV